MAETHLDHPGEVSWFAGHGPKPPLGLACDHGCDHAFTCAVIAWGPDYEHYSIVECSECGCRSWTVEYPPPHSVERPKFRLGGLMQMHASGDEPCGECGGSGLVRVITQEPPDDDERECRSCANASGEGQAVRDA